MGFDFWTITVGNLLMFGGTALGFAYTWFAASRDRKWTQEDNIKKAEQLAAKVAADAAAVAEKIKLDAIQLAINSSAETSAILERTKNEIDILTVKVEESILASKVALTQANNFHLKLDGFNKELTDVTNSVKLLMEKFLTPKRKPRKRS